MDIKIITIHAMHNPGSVFQAYALQEYLKKEYDPSIIDYRPDYFYNEGSGFKYFLKRTLFHNVWNSRNRKFSSFIEKYLSLTSRYTTYQQLERASLKADVFIVGSDQLWNTDYECGLDRAFYLDFTCDGKRISYSTSIGKKNIEEDDIKLYIEKLRKFDYLSVREKSTATFLSQKLERPVEWVCDPVMLLDCNDYNKFLKEKLFHEEYVMIYLLEASELLDSIVYEYRKQGYTIVLAGGFTKRCFCDIHIKDVGPEDFLTLIYYAKIVVSSSFHATVFSHIFHKEFITIIPEKNGERIISVLQLSGLLNRGIKGQYTRSILLDRVDWEKVDARLQPYILNSKEYLQRSIRG